MSIWTDTRVKQLKALWNEGLSASQIASEISDPLRNEIISRNAVISKIHRIGMAGRVKPERPKHVPPARPRRVPSPHGNAKLSIQGRGKIVLLDAESEPFEPRVAVVEPPLNLDITQLTEDTCRYPLGDGTDDSPYLFCGHSPLNGSPYCPGHSAICFVAPPQRRNVSEEERERRRAFARKHFGAHRETEDA